MRCYSLVNLTTNKIKMRKKKPLIKRENTTETLEKESREKRGGEMVCTLFTFSWQLEPVTRSKHYWHKMLCIYRPTF